MVYNFEKSQPQVVLVPHSGTFSSSILLFPLIVGSIVVRSLSLQIREHPLLGNLSTIDIDSS